MPAMKKPADPERRAQLIAELRKDQRTREQSYRVRALKLFPHVCGRCGREFEGKRLRELTVHHRDHDHNNNPPDGSNWELLCLYCHDDEHEKYRKKGVRASAGQNKLPNQPALGNPFDSLDGLLK